MTWKIIRKHLKWFALSAAALLAVVFGLLMRSSRRGVRRASLPPLDEKIREKVRQAEEEALVARVEAKVKAETEVKKLEEVAEISDGAERRKRLAEMLNDL